MINIYSVVEPFVHLRGKEKLEIIKECGEPACGRAANYGGLLSPPSAAKNVRANLRIAHFLFTKNKKDLKFIE